jgi:antitoxin component YwqK of YwqJK toxin-antitoxin module
MVTLKKYYLFSRKLKEETEYNDEGKREGITRIYYRNGSLKKEMIFKNGKKEGPSKRFFKDGARFEYECKNGLEKVGRWRNYDENGLLVMEKVYTTTNDLLCELYYEYGEYGRIVTLQWTKFLDDEIEKYKQKANEYDEVGNPGFPFLEREKYPLVEASSFF